MIRITPKPHYLEPMRRTGGRWDYGFEALEVGDQLRVPVTRHEKPARVAKRVSSAVCCWRGLHYYRRHRRYAVNSRSQYVLVERIS